MGLRDLLIPVLLMAGTVMSPAAHAMTLETETLQGWKVAAYATDQKGVFQTCAMQTAADDGTFLTISVNAHNRWFLWLYRGSWDLAPGARLVATVNLDLDRKSPIALDAKLRNEHYLALLLPPDIAVLDLLGKASSVRVSRETRSYTFDLAGYGQAVQWVKACLARHGVLEAAKPDARIKGEDDAVEGPGDAGSARQKPSEGQKPPQTLPPGMLEVRTIEPHVPPVVSAGTSDGQGASSDVDAHSVGLSDPTPSVAAPAHIASSQTAPTEAETAARMSVAGRATSAPILEPPAAIINGARLMLPNLMSAAKRSDFRILDLADAPVSASRAQVVFELAGAYGRVLSVDAATPEAAANEALASDRIACEGTFSSVIDPPREDRADVQHAQANCITGATTADVRYVVLARRAGGYFVVTLKSEAPPADLDKVAERLAVADRAVFDAALDVAGKF